MAEKKTYYYSIDTREVFVFTVTTDDELQQKIQYIRDLFSIPPSKVIRTQLEEIEPGSKNSQEQIKKRTVLLEPKEETPRGVCCFVDFGEKEQKDEAEITRTESEVENQRENLEKMMRFELSVEFPDGDRISIEQWFWEVIFLELRKKGLFQNTQYSLISGNNEVVFSSGKPVCL